MKSIVASILDSEYSDKRFYKIVYYLKNRWYINPLKKDLYFVKNIEDIYSDAQLTDMFYWSIVKDHLKKYLTSDWYIGWLKALELNIQSFDVVDEILIVNNYKQSVEVLVFDKKVSFKTYYSWEKKIFNKFYKYTEKVKVRNLTFQVASLELAIIESLYNTPDLMKWYVEELVKKILRKHKNSLDLSILKVALINNKHHSSINRLYKISLFIDQKLADRIKDLIKKYSYFISV